MHDWTAYWNDEKGEATLCDSIDISIAVATEKVLNLKFPESCSAITISTNCDLTGYNWHTGFDDPDC